MIPLRLAEVATAVEGTLRDVPDGRVVVSGPVVVDSRHATPGALFVAVPGEHVDGHDYAAPAVAAGAVAVLAARPVGVPAVLVPDTVAALGRLARAVVDRLPGTTVVGITGSSGKTGTKDLLAQLLGRLGDTVAPRGSYNNEIGLPLTVTEATSATRFLVLEMGARGAGHVRALCDIAAPAIGAVLNVGSAHLGEFGGRNGVATAKGELVAALPPDGVAVLNADDPLVRAMAARTSARVVTFGLERSGDGTSDPDVCARDVTLDEAGRPRFTIATPEGSAPVALRLYGEHNVPNALAAACVAREVGMPVQDVATALSDAVPRSRWRMEVTERPDGVTVVNDAYNANPESVRAALKALVGMARGRRTWAVLGEMRELGEGAAAEHDTIGRLVVRLDVSRLIAVGPGARPVHLGASLEGSWGEESAHVPDAEAAVALLREHLRPGDVVLVKASRAAGLERVAEALLAPPVIPPAGVLEETRP